jgi:hypothetical protein
MTDAGTHEITLRLTVTLRLVEGEPQPSDYILDAFAGTIGRQNAAAVPLLVEVGGDETDGEYEVWLVDELDGRP